MYQMRLGEKGQFTLPKALRDRYALHKGDRVRIVDLGNGILQIVALRHSSRIPFAPIRPSRKGTVEEMEEVVAESVVESYQGGITR